MKRKTTEEQRRKRGPPLMEIIVDDIDSIPFVLESCLKLLFKEREEVV